MTLTLFLWGFVVVAALSLALIFFLTRSQHKQIKIHSGPDVSQPNDAKLQEQISALETEIARLKDREPQVEFISYIPTSDKVSHALSTLDMSSVLENTYDIVPLDDPRLKGRVVGKEGQNIRAFEYATGTELLMDEYPNALVISCFSPQRRALAVRCLKVLLQGGKIYPQRIIETVSHARESQNKEHLNIARTHFKPFEVAQSFSEDLLIQFGALHQQVYQGLNLLRYIKEVALLAGQMANHLGLNPHIAEGFCLAALAEIHFLTPPMTPGIHEPLDRSEKQLLKTLLHLAGELSYQRVHKRAQNQAHFFERQEALETHCLEVPGVARAHALRTGKEVRVFVTPIEDRAKNELKRSLKDHLLSFSPEGSPVKVTVIDALC